MSEKGVLSKSIANNISEAIIDKLGGSGYAPTEWSKNINLLGISSADIEEALASITEDDSSSDKGLLSLSIASDVGAILNKKYNTSRGFKPSEVSSAVSALIPLPEKTASGSIVTFSDGADDVPLKSCEVALSASLDGYSSVDVVQTGKNLFDKSAVIDNTWIVVNDTTTESAVGYRTSGYIPVKANTRYFVTGKWSNRSAYYDTNKNGIAFFSFSGGVAFTALYDGYIRITIKNDVDLDTFIVNEGNTEETYEPFGTTYTALLGRTIYGGVPDVVKGEGTEQYKYRLLNDPTKWKIHSGSTLDFYYDEVFDDRELFDTSYEGIICEPFPTVRVTNTTYARWNSAVGYYFGVKSEDGAYTLSDIQQMASDGQISIAYKLAIPTDFTFSPIEINSRLGNNTMWSEQGDMSVIYRADIDLYEAPGMLLEANNTETEGNEEQEVNE